MKNVRLPAVLAAGVILLAGCASAKANDTTGSRASAPAAGAMDPGMVMADGSTMGATSGSASPVTASGPSSATQMICAAETRADITKVLALSHAPSSTSSWSDETYTCTYHLPMGEFVLSVKQSANNAAAKTYAETARQRLSGQKPLAGLTETAFGTSSGVVVLVKDNDTLRVDATRLPAEFGTQNEKRADFAYEIASDILGCWTGDDGS